VGKVIRRLLTLAIVGWIVGGVVSALVAVAAKRSMISQGDELSDEIDIIAIFEGRSFTSRAAAFRGGSALAWYSAARIDLRGATLDPAGGRLRVRALFGGLQVLVPESWSVDIQARAFLAGVTRDILSAELTPGPVLVIEGWACFGGIEITTEDEVDWSGQASTAATAPAAAAITTPDVGHA
jgi:hypothetical protein